MAELTNAMKGVIQSSTARTSSTYASTDLIQLYDSNNEPTIKISKDDLMSSVKAALPSLLSDQGTSGTAFPSIASGVLGSMTAANLASVLGGAQIPSFSDFDDAPTGLWNIYTIGNFSNKPSAARYAGVLKSAVSESSKFQYFVEVGSNNFRAWSRTRWYNNNWSPWEEISTDIPNFYKSYNDLSSLASALGATKESQELIVDLGLPSGTLWATHNIDVTMQNGFTKSIYQYECSFFSWGNTFGVNPISSSAFSYNWGTGNDGPYASTPGASLTGNAGLGYDAAFANFGNSWKLPTTEDFVELLNSSNTKYVDASGTEIADATNKLTTINGITGICLMSKANGKTIFFPCSGYGNSTSWYVRGSYGLYWSSSLFSSTNGRYLSFDSGGVYPQYYGNRFYGFAVRPVQ